MDQKWIRERIHIRKKEVDEPRGGVLPTSTHLSLGLLTFVVLSDLAESRSDEGSSGCRNVDNLCQNKGCIFMN